MTDAKPKGDKALIEQATGSGAGKLTAPDRARLHALARRGLVKRAGDGWAKADAKAKS